MNISIMYMLLCSEENFSQQIIFQSSNHRAVRTIESVWFYIYLLISQSTEAY